MRRTSACLAVIAVVISLSVVAPGAASATSLGGTGIGYLEAQSDGVVFATGSAQSYGSVTHPHAAIVGIAAQPGGKGYVLAGADGGVFTFGSAKFYGSMGGAPLTKRVVGVAYTPTGNGYYLVAADGGIFTFGDAVFRGSTGAAHLPAPIVAMTPTRDGRGYWLAGRDGAVYPFGSAPFLGAALTPIQIQTPVTAIATSASGAGYLLMGRFGEVAAFGDAARCSISPRVHGDRSPRHGRNAVVAVLEFGRRRQSPVLVGVTDHDQHPSDQGMVPSQGAPGRRRLDCVQPQRPAVAWGRSGRHLLHPQRTPVSRPRLMTTSAARDARS